MRSASMTRTPAGFSGSRVSVASVARSKPRKKVPAPSWKGSSVNRVIGSRNSFTSRSWGTATANIPRKSKKCTFPGDGAMIALAIVLALRSIGGGRPSHQLRGELNQPGWRFTDREGDEMVDQLIQLGFVGEQVGRRRLFVRLLLGLPWSKAQDSTPVGLPQR